jgi:hypothetical protein
MSTSHIKSTDATPYQNTNNYGLTVGYLEGREVRIIAYHKNTREFVDLSQHPLSEVQIQQIMDLSRSILTSHASSSNFSSFVDTVDSFDENGIHLKSKASDPLKYTYKTQSYWNILVASIKLLPTESPSSYLITPLLPSKTDLHSVDLGKRSPRPLREYAKTHFSPKDDSLPIWDQYLNVMVTEAKQKHQTAYAEPSKMHQLKTKLNQLKQMHNPKEAADPELLEAIKELEAELNNEIQLQVLTQDICIDMKNKEFKDQIDILRCATVAANNGELSQAQLKDIFAAFKEANGKEYSALTNFIQTNQISLDLLLQNPLYYEHLENFLNEYYNTTFQSSSGE